MSKKVISFSLYGKNPDYILGAIANARHANRAYPGWVCRFYVADDVPLGVISRLKDYGAEIVSMGRRVRHEPMFWRFLAAVDPENDITLVRDADSRFTKCELLMVNEWLASSKKFHVIRGAWDYQTPIMGGLWGVRGGIPDLREILEEYMPLGTNTGKGADQRFLTDNLYPKMKGKVFVHEQGSCVKRMYFVNETIHPVPPIAKEKRGKYLNLAPLQAGMKMPTKRNFVVLSIYKSSPLSEYFLAQLLAALETRKSFYWFSFRFYVADDIRPDLVKRLRHFGKVILKPAKTTRKDDPQYWNLSILSEKNLGAVAMVDFWQLFFLVRAPYGGLGLREYQPIEYKRQSVGVRSKFRQIAPKCTFVPSDRVANIDELIAQRNPGESYSEFIRSTVRPRISTITMLMGNIGIAGALNSWLRVLLPLRLYTVASTIRTYLNLGYK